MDALIYQKGYLPLTQIRVIFPQFGSCLDAPHKRGGVNLMLNLLERGAGERDDLVFTREMERLGATISATAHNDHVVIGLDVLNDAITPACQLLMDLIWHPHLSEEAFMLLQREIISSWISEREQSKQTRAYEVFWECLSQQHQAYFAPTGTQQGLQQLTLADVKMLHNQLIRDTKPFIGVCANLSKSDITTQLQPLIDAVYASSTAAVRASGDAASGKHLSAAKQKIEQSTAWPWEQALPPQAEGIQVCIVPEHDTETDEIIIGHFTDKSESENWHLHELIAHIFGGDMNSRLFRIMRGQHGYTYGASGWYEINGEHIPPNQITPFCCHVFPSNEYTAPALTLLLKLYQDFIENGPSSDELAEARQALINAYPFQTDTPQKLLFHAMKQKLYGIELDPPDQYREKMQNVQLKDLQTVLHQTHSLKHLQIVLLGDPKRLRPIATDLPGVGHITEMKWPSHPVP